MKLIIYTAGRSDFDRYVPILNGLKKDRSLNFQLVAGKSHYVKKFGYSYREIINKGFNLIKRKKTNIKDVRSSLGFNLSEEIFFLTKIFYKQRPNAVVVLGDRYEMLASPIAAMGFNIPVIHIYGGPVTEGAIDELVRHSITKMSHLHLVVAEKYKQRISQLGEQSSRIKVVGLANLEEILKVKKINKDEMKKFFGLDFENPTILATFHPVTIELENLEFQVNSFLKAIQLSNLQCIFTYPNNDTGHDIIIKKINKFVSANSQKYKFVVNAKAKYYYNLMRNCEIMVGNSSSGIVEASSFKLPVVNIGTRQDGKIRSKNILNAKYFTNSILFNIKIAKSKKFKETIKNIVNPYFKKNSTINIVKEIKKIRKNDFVIRKKFIDHDC